MITMDIANIGTYFDKCNHFCKKFVKAQINFTNQRKIFADFRSFLSQDEQSPPVIEKENNPFVGTVISAKTESGEIFFGSEDLFKTTN